MKDDVLHIDTDGHIPVSHRHDYLCQFILQLFGYIDGLPIFQAVTADKKGFMIAFGCHTLFSLLIFHEILCYWFIASGIQLFIQLFYLGDFISHSFLFIGIPCETSSIWQRNQPCRFSFLSYSLGLI